MRANRVTKIRPLLAGSSLLLCASNAAAHDPPFVRDVLWSNAATDETWLWTNRGLMMGTPGSDYRLLCTQGMDVTSNEQVAVLRKEDGSILLGSSSGLTHSTDGGCSFAGVAPYGDTPVYGLVRIPGQAQGMWMVTGDEARAVYASTDEGATFEPVYTIPESEYFMQLLPASGDHILYARILNLADEEQRHMVGRSADGGETWQRHPVPLLDSEGEYAFLAAHPQDTERFMIKALDNTPALMDRVLLSTDGGANFSELLKVAELKAAQFSADGSQILVSGRDGLWTSDDGGVTFAHAPEARRISFAATHDQALYVAGLFEGILPAVDGIGRSQDGGRTFEPFVLFTDVKQALACPAESPTAQVCASLWGDWQREILSADGATSNGTTDSSTTDNGSAAVQGADGPSDTSTTAVPTAGSLSSAATDSPSLSGPGSDAAAPTSATTGEVDQTEANASPSAPSSADSSGCGIARGARPRGFGMAAAVGLLAVVTRWRRTRRKRQQTTD